MKFASFSRSAAGRQQAFLLLEIILAVALFTLGVLALGRCLNNCLTAQQIRGLEDRARLALENRMAEIQASPVLPDESKLTKLGGMFSGMTLIERRHAVDLKNEDNVSLSDLHEVDLTVEWRAPDGRKLSRTVAFDLLRGRG